jgi:hypothetical protein
LLSQIGSTFFPNGFATQDRRERRTVRLVLGRLQDTRGEPRLRIRILAAVIIFGLLVFSAPLLMIPLVDWIAHQL